MYKKSTQVPNVILDHYLPNLNLAELKILLVIVRQTFGWVDKRTGKRKGRDRISQSQFLTKTGLSKRAITSVLNNLSRKALIIISDQNGNILQPEQRKGNPRLFYALRLAHFTTSNSAKRASNSAQKKDARQN